MHDYFTVRPILNEIIDEILKKIKSKGDKITISKQISIKKKIKKKNYSLLYMGICNEILEEVIKEYTISIYDEINGFKIETMSFFARIVKDICSVENVVLNKRRTETIIREILFSQPAKRILKPDIHSLPVRQFLDLSNNGKNIVFYDHILTPNLIKKNINIISEDETLKLWTTFTTKEMLYWSKFRSTVGEYHGTISSKAITYAKSSFDERFLALSTIEGHIAIVDFFFKPPRIVRYHEATTSQEIIEISWNYSSTQIITLTKTGDLIVWSLIKKGVAEPNKKPTNVFKFQKINDNFIPLPLQNIFSLNTAYNDFRFFSGPLVALTKENNPIFPTVAKFDLSFTYCGLQPSIITALSNNQILKCNLLEDIFSEGDEHNYRANYAYSHPPINRENLLLKNKIGSDVNVELYSWHKCKIIFIGIVNCEKLISMDEQGNVCSWNYKLANVKDDLFYEPTDIFKIKMSKLTYSPNGNIKILYSQQNSSKNKQITLAEAENQIKKLNKSHEIWHNRISADNLFETNVFVPLTGVTQEGTELYVVTYDCKNMKKLQTLLTQSYIPFELKCEKIVATELTKDGQYLIIALLYPEKSPKESNVTFILLDAIKMTLKNLKLEIVLSSINYEACKTGSIYCDMSKPIEPLGCQYLFINVSSSIHVFSLATGQEICIIGDRKDFPLGFSGLRIEHSVSNDDQLNVNIYRNLLFLCLTSTKKVKYDSNPFTVVVLRDMNERAQFDDMKELSLACTSHLPILSPIQSLSNVRNVEPNDEDKEVKDQLYTSIFTLLPQPVAVARYVLDAILAQAIKN